MRTGPEREPRATREYQPANRREHNITRRRRFTFCPLPVAVTSKKTSEKRSFRPLTNRQPYQRFRSATWHHWFLIVNESVIAGFAASRLILPSKPFW